MGRRIVTLDLADRARILARLSLLEGVAERDLSDIAVHAHVLTFAGGDVIVPEGEEGLGFYVIIAGTARVERGGESIQRLGPGDFFGEIALLQKRPRTASVLAEGSTTCLGILRTHFRPLLARNPRLALRILEEEAARSPDA